MLKDLQSEPSETEVCLAAVLAGRAPPQSCPDVSVMGREICNHGIDGLASAAPELWPRELSSDLRAQAIAHQFWEDHHKKRVAEVLTVLNEAKVPSMLIKGTACAYSVYDQPWTRTRGDSDLVIEPDHRAKAISALLDLGYRRGLSFSEEDGVGQISFERVETGPGFSHVIDLHWRINNSEVLSGLFSPAQLLDRAVPLPRLSAHALGPDPADALLITCFHRYVHRVSPYTVQQTELYSEDRLIWIMDIHLLANAMVRADWEEFVRRALDAGLGNICASGLAMSRTLFGTRVPGFARKALGQSATMSAAERYLMASKWGRFWQDLAARPGISSKVTLLRAHVFPPEGYMRARFAEKPAAPLALLYLIRMWRGMMRRFRVSNPG